MDTALIDNRYRPIRVLGEGAMGQVYLVEDTIAGTQKALKRVLDPLATSTKVRLQFKQEFRLMAQLHHKHCCTVHDFGIAEDGLPYLTMEYVPGTGLDELGRLPVPQVRDLLVQLLLALHHVHQLGYLHRDLKPQNIRVQPDGTLKLMDYGLMEPAGLPSDGLKGTLAYLAPEVIKRSRLDARSDLYALGALAYEMVVGEVPFRGATPREVLLAHLESPIEPPSRFRPDVPEELERVILRLLAKDPLERYRSAADVLAALGAELPEGARALLFKSPLVGRDAELAVLREALAACVGGTSKTILLTGAAGIGKSRLVEEFRCHAQLEGAVHAHGSCQFHAKAPYAPFIPVLRALLPALAARSPARYAELAPILKRLLPELDVAPAPALSARDAECQRLHDAVKSCLADLGDAGAIVVLDNWQWADPCSDELLQHLTRGDRPRGLMIVVVSRMEGLRPAPWHAEATPLTLAGLPEAAIARMVASMLGDTALPEALVAAVATWSQGVPFAIERLLEHLTHSALALQDGHWQLTQKLDPERPPADFGLWILARVAALPPDAQALASIAAVLGHRITLHDLALGSGLDENALCEAVHVLVDARILEPCGAGQYAFAHDQDCEHLLADLDDSVRARSHTRVACGLASDWPSPERAPLARLMTIADHWLASDAPADGLDWLLEAGKHAVDLAANTRAESYLRKSLGLLRALDDHGERLRRCLDLLEEVVDRTGERQAAMVYAEEALALAEAAGDHRAMTLLTVRLATATATQNLANGLALGQRALALAETLGDGVILCRVLLALASLQAAGGESEKSLGTAERGLAIARSAGDADVEASLRAFLAPHYAEMPDHAAQGAAYIEEALRVHQGIGNRLALYSDQCDAAIIAGQAGHLETARAYAEDARRSAEAIGLVRAKGYVCYLAGVIALRQGQTQLAHVLALEGLVSARITHNRFDDMLLEWLSGCALAHMFRFSEAEEAFGRSAAIMTEAGFQDFTDDLAVGRAEAAWLAGDATAALATLGARSGRTDQTGVPCLRALALIAAGRDADALAALDVALQTPMNCEAEAWTRLARAQACVSLERWSEAADDAKASLDAAVAAGALQVAAQAHGVLGEVALARAQGDAEAHFEAMFRLAEEIGAVPLQAIARFGRAAAKPYDPEAAARVAQSKLLLESVLAPLDAPVRERLAAMRDFRRVLEGNHVAFSLPVTSASSPHGFTGPLGLMHGSF
ncbi:MAG TPA: AAA family ATPase [Oscillatoriaceae cyanobacterium]